MDEPARREAAAGPGTGRAATPGPAPPGSAAAAGATSATMAREPPPLLSIRDLEVEFRLREQGTVRAVKGVSFDVPAGGTVALVGESGSGKSVIAQAVLGILPKSAHVTGGHILFADPERPSGAPPLDLARLDPDAPAYRALRGGRISIIFQEPMTSLSPLHTVGDQIVEALRLHRRDCSRSEAREVVREMLDLVRFPDPAAALDTYPFQLSGGLRQRAMIAMALVCRPALLVADEPTTALDVIVQARTLKLMRDLQSELHMALLLITHDLGVVASLADEVVVVYHGRLMERGAIGDLFRDPRHPYLKALMRAVPRMGMDRGERLTPVRSIDVRGEGSPLAGRGGGAVAGVGEGGGEGGSSMSRAADFPLLQLEHVSKQYAPRDRFRLLRRVARRARGPGGSSNARTGGREAKATVAGNGGSPDRERETGEAVPTSAGARAEAGGRRRAVDRVSFRVDRGECLGLVGESGCGKTTVSKMIMRAVDPDEGAIVFDDHGAPVRLDRLRDRDLIRFRPRIQLVFQDPFSSLDPRMTVFDIVSEPLVIHGIGDHASRVAKVKGLMSLTGLDPRWLGRYPHSFSGGQRQRIGIARALALEPELLICDEPVSALDVSVQAQVLNLLKDLQRELGLTYLFISHNLAVVDYMADRIAVMCAGRLVEVAPREVLFERPVHPYTRALLAAVPRAELDHRLDLDALMSGEASDPARWPAPFADRGADAPDLVDVGAGTGAGHQVRAWPGPLLEALT